VTDTKTLKPTAASAWKKIEPTAVKLPSGNTALLKKPNMYVLMKSGQIPDSIKKTLENGEDATFAEKQELIEYQISLTFINPEVTVDDKKEGVLHIDEIEDEDKTAVIEFIGG
jgi:hypothetical protein